MPTAAITPAPANLGGTSQSSTLGGGIGGWLGDVYGSKYGIPNPVATAGSAISGNIGNLSGIYDLTVGADQAAAAGAQSELLANLPDYSGMLNQATTNVGQELQGQLPQDVVSQLQSNAAERGVAGGFGVNSPNNNAAFLRALGLTSLGEMQQGQQGFGQLVQETPQGPQFNPSTMMVTPEQEQAAQLAANQMAAAPDPELTGFLNSLS